MKKDPTNSIERKTDLLKKSPLAEEVCQQLQPQIFTPPRLYGLLKIRKPDVPLRRIVNTVDSLTCRLVQHLAGLLICHTDHLPHHVKNWIEFVHVLGSFRADTHDIVASLDIVSLFTKMPINGNLGLLGRHSEDVLGLFRHVPTISYFTSMDSSADKLMVWPWARRFLRS
jgi:hypothetical protein